ncbi:unnamed protein product, partial [Meganyctiphanes norvegica]
MTNSKNGDIDSKNSKAKKDKENGAIKDEKEKKNDLPPVPFFQLFQYSNTKEKWLMFTGAIAALVAGLCMPAMIIMFGDVTNAFVYDDINITAIRLQEQAKGNNYTMEQLMEAFAKEDFFKEITKFGIGCTIIGILQLAMGYIFVASMNYAAEGQVYRLRGLFLLSILKQEIGWFDTHQTNDFASRVT